MFILTLQQIQVQPTPQLSRNQQGRFYLTHLTLNCQLQASEQNCSQDVYDNFNFYEQLLFQRDEPYTQQEYKDQNLQEIISNVQLIIDNFSYTNETYTLEVNSSGIIINAASVFASSRAFASMMQLSTPDSQKLDDRKRYKIDGIFISDAPSYPFRFYEADFCSHYTNKKDILTTIDAASMTKLNHLIIDLTCAHQFPILFNKQNLQPLANGAYSEKHFYDEQDLREIAEYGMKRGVIIVPKIEIPGRTASWKYANQNLVGKCPRLEKQNINNVVLRMDQNSTIQIVKDVITSIKDIFFKDFQVQPYIHFGGSLVQLKCLEEDPEVSNYVSQSPGMTYSMIYQQFQNEINALLQEKGIIGIFDENVINQNIKVNNNSIIHFTSSVNKQKANDLGLKQIHSTQMFAHLMHPNNGYHYFWQDTWRDMTNVDVSQQAKSGLALGGGIVQTGRNCVARSCLEHSFNRALGALFKLWSTNGYKNSREIDTFSCKLMKAGIPTGPLEIGEPCLGYPFI